MKFSIMMLFTVLSLSVSTSCSRPNNVGQLNKQPVKQGEVGFHDGYDTDPRDRGRPVVLIGSALGVKPEIFRSAFKGVSPSKIGPPTPSRARSNKKVLMDALGKHGVTNERLDEVSNYYRYNRQAGEMWKLTPASATAIVKNGKVTGFNITNAGSGYTTVPRIVITGFEDVKVKATVGFSTDFTKNGSVTSLEIVE